MNIEEKIQNSFKKFVGVKIRSINFMNFDYASNNYSINDSYVIRTPKITHDDNISYNNELLINEALKDSNLTEKIIYFNKTNGLKISRIIHSFRDIDNSNEIIFDIIKTIKKLHSFSNTVETKFDFKKAIYFYKKHLNCNDFIDNELENSILNNLINTKDKNALVLSHNNLDEEKIFVQNNFIKIIDFRFSSLNSPLYDLANISIILKLNSEKEKLLLKKYFGSKNKIKNIKLLNVYKKYILLNNYYKNAYYFNVTGETYYLLNKEKYKNYLNSF